MSTFTWIPAPGAGRTLRPRTRAAKFGDGYEQRFVDGLNAKLPSWDVSFPGKTSAEANAIDDFLSDLDGVGTFDWTDPRGNAGKFLCREWRLTEVGSDTVNVSATFEQVPA